MYPAALRIGVFLSIVSPCTSAFGHGEPPTASAVLSHDAEGPRAVRLSAGVALRRAAQRYQFVCPAAWGDQFPASLAALPDGTLVVGATRGLALLSADGTLLPHPDPAALGHSSELVRSAHGVFAVRTAAEGSEVLAIDAQQARVLWKDPKFWYSLTAFDDKLVLLRGEGVTLEQVTLEAASGAELDRQKALLELPLDYVFARTAGGVPYALVVLRSSSSVLGTLAMNTFTRLAGGLLSIAGPLRVGDETLLATDGALSQLFGTELQPLTDGPVVHCLDHHDGLLYACDADGISQLNGRDLGEPLFRLSWLTAPNLEQVSSGEARERCSAQWEDLRADLRMAGTTLLAETLLDAGWPAAAAPDQGDEPPADAGSSASDAQPAEHARVPMAEQGRSACSALPGSHSSHTAFIHAFGLLLALALVRHTRFVISLARLAQLYRMALLRSAETRSASEGEHARNQRTVSARTRASTSNHDASSERALATAGPCGRAGSRLRARCNKRQ